MNKLNKENFIKKLLYKSRHRGSKENCLILSKFAEQFLPNMHEKELLDFSLILDQNDTDLYEWITHKTKAPAFLNQLIMQNLLKLYKE